MPMWAAGAANGCRTHRSGPPRWASTTTSMWSVCRKPALSKFAKLLVAAHLLAFGAAIQAQDAAPGPQESSKIIVNAQVADGRGGPLRAVSVRIMGERITQVGRFSAWPGEQVIDAKGLVLAPGFIDIHNHSGAGLESEPTARTQISQGITTVVLGADGKSPWPLAKWLDARRRKPMAPNVAMLVGHATVRVAVMGDDYKRSATSAEVARMVQLVKQGMNAGAFGLSSGLEYEVGTYASTDEVIAMARGAAEAGGFYMPHIRDEADKAFEALRETIEIGERGGIPVQHSHIKLASAGVWGKSAEYIREIEEAQARGIDVLADCYPYEAWWSTIKVLIPNKKYQDPKSVERALADAGGAGRILITKFPPNPSYENHTLEELAHAARISPVKMYIRVIREGEAAGVDAYVVGHAMTEEDVDAFLRQPWVMISSDGGIGMPHPRTAGTFPRVLAHYVREKHLISLPEAIRKMTSLPAQRMGWVDRGVIRPGAFADLVLFDPQTVQDRSTFADPWATATGIAAVFVNGTLTWKSGESTGALPGRVLTR